jgi:transcriptional regulator with XRE-family HTH domain
MNPDVAPRFLCCLLGNTASIVPGMGTERPGGSAARTGQAGQCGPRLRSLRAARGWTLDELAERTGLSKAFLSRLEGGDRRPSVAAMVTLARAYDVTIGSLFEGDPPSPEACVVRGDRAPVLKGDGLLYVALSNTARFANLQPIRLTIRADRRGDERFEHEGEEWIYVLRGRVLVALGGAAHVLDVGDAAHFDSRVPHRLSALDGADAEVIVVACPLPESAWPAPPRRPGVRGRRAPRGAAPKR